MSTDERARMVENHLARRGIGNPRILEAFRRVPREQFLPPELAEFAYRDAPLPIAEGQTISQPYVVAMTVDALDLKGGERVLEIGTGSGYAAAILSQVASKVFTVERYESLANDARERLARLGYDNVEVLHGDGTLGWPEHAPYDAIAVAAGGPRPPEALLSQLKSGGRLVIPVGETESQVLLTITKHASGELTEERLAEVRFVPLIGEQGWADDKRGDIEIARVRSSTGDASLVRLVTETAEPITDLNSSCVEALVERIGDARLVLLGEATHGTSEFYRMRARITMELIEKRGFDFVAVEADWPDAARIDTYVLGEPPRSGLKFTPFSRFPAWMWRNEEVDEFVGRLRAYNLSRTDRAERVGFHGLDLYSMFTSMAAVLEYLGGVDPAAANAARARYGTLTPWQKDPAAYGKAVLVGRYASSEEAVVRILRDLLQRRMDYALKDGERFFDAVQNARVVADAERYYRAMYYGSATSWNLRDSHMFDTLQSLLAFYGPQSRGIVWEHNSHLGDARATEMSERGELNVGQLCREKFGDKVYIVGFGTDHGTVAAASNWDEPVERMTVRPSHEESYERLFHDSDVPAFLTHLREPRRADLRDELMPSRLERAIGVIYRPETERGSHYFYASLPQQFDEYIWFDRTTAVSPLPAPARDAHGQLPETYPFGL
ncbi:MAG TPA: protein-L-isoaspartate(D-aspartate) O-methyltransferase [Candidatus Limnocylindrales bacterium]|nr:protein-L-isoaspartate(D-aspartate) O-methyltransferase [Candidatus Limnocylindrales bacterium]